MVQPIPVAVIFFLHHYKSHVFRDLEISYNMSPNISPNISPKGFMPPWPSG